MLVVAWRSESFFFVGNNQYPDVGNAQGGIGIHRYAGW